MREEFSDTWLSFQNESIVRLRTLILDWRSTRRTTVRHFQCNRDPHCGCTGKPLQQTV